MDAEKEAEAEATGMYGKDKPDIVCKCGVPYAPTRIAEKLHSAFCDLYLNKKQPIQNTIPI